MIDSTTPPAALRRPAAQDRHPWKGAVHKALSPFSGHRPASTGRRQATARAMESIIYGRGGSTLGDRRELAGDALAAPVAHLAQAAGLGARVATLLLAPVDDHGHVRIVGVVVVQAVVQLGSERFRDDAIDHRGRMLAIGNGVTIGYPLIRR